MALITFRVLDGADRGQTYENVPTPLTVGREEGNPIQLNDERISRFHLKIQDDKGSIVLTDLESTNGTKVNGESVSLWILRPGDMIEVGRTILVYGTREQIATRLASLRGENVEDWGIPLDADDLEERLMQETSSSYSLDMELVFGDEPDARDTLHRLMPPDPIPMTSPSQVAHYSEMLMYLQLRIRALIRSVEKDKESTVDVEFLRVHQRHWQNILDLQFLLAKYLKALTEPEE